MDRRPFRTAFAFLAVALLALGVPAHAVTFSFASDDNHDGPTLVGHSGGSMPDDINDAAAFSADGTVNVDLMVDLNDDAAGGIVIFPAELELGLDVANYTLTPRGGNFIHQWDVSGKFQFRHAGTGQLLLAVSFENGLFTSWSPNIATLGETATLQDNDGVDSAITFNTYTLLKGIGVTNASVLFSEDFAFTLTRIRSLVFTGLPFLDHGQFLHGWVSESSFSAHATGLSSEEPVE